MGSCSFDGVNDYIQYAESAALDPLEIGEYLILAWSRPGTAGNNNGRIFTRGPNNSTANDHMQLLIGNGSNGSRVGDFTGRQSVTNAGIPGNYVSADNVIPNSAWHCFGHQYRDSTNTMRIFNAGVAITPKATSVPTDNVDVKGTSPVTIGDTGTTPTRTYHGHIAYIGIWNILGISDADVNTLVSAFYNGGTGTADVPRQDILVEFLRLTTSGQATGDKSVLTSPTISGVTFDAAQSAPVIFNALGGGVDEVVGAAIAPGSAVFAPTITSTLISATIASTVSIFAPTLVAFLVELSGTILDVTTEADIRTGGKTLVITLNDGDTFIP